MTTFAAFARLATFSVCRDGSIIRDISSLHILAREEISGPHAKQLKAVAAMYAKLRAEHPDDGFDLQVHYTGERRPVNWPRRFDDLRRIYNPLAKEITK